MATGEQWAQGLQGAGAWFSGQGPQYEATKALQVRQGAEDDRQRKLDELAMDKARVDALTKDFTQTYSFIKMGKPELAVELLQNRIPLIEKMGGDATDSRELLAALSDPARLPEAEAELTSFLSAAGVLPVPGSAQASPYSGMFTTQDGQRAGLNPATGQIEIIPTAGGITARVPMGESGAVMPSSRQKEWDQYQMLLKTDPAAAKAFGMSAGFVGGEGSELSVHLQKRLSTATDSAQEARTNQAQFSVLANDFENSDLGSGYLGGTWTEKVKELSGTQDADSLLRKRYLALRSSQVVKNLPPGAASDADIAMALEGWPPANAKKEMVAQFMRGMAKLEGYQDTFETYKANYISDNGTERNLLETWRAETGKPATPAAAPAQRKGGTLMMDAAGNQAYVYPDGTVEEVR